MEFVLYYSVDDNLQYDYITGINIQEVFANIGQFLKDKNAIFKYCEAIKKD